MTTSGWLVAVPAQIPSQTFHDQQQGSGGPAARRGSGSLTGGEGGSDGCEEGGVALGSGCVYPGYITGSVRLPGHGGI